MKIFINRLRWLSAGIYLGMALFAWLAQDNDKKIDLTKKWSGPYNFNKHDTDEEIRKMADNYPIPDISLVEDRPVEFDEDFSSYKHNHNKEAY